MNTPKDSTGGCCPPPPCSRFLPCPFCGSDKIEVIYDDGYSVGCKDCSTYVAPFLGAEADDKQKHIDFWNTRAPVCSANVVITDPHRERVTQAQKGNEQ